MSLRSIAAILLCAATASTYCGVGLFRTWAEKRQILDFPNERSSHVRPTPRGGGLVIAVVTILGGALLVFLFSPAQWVPYLFYVIGALLVAVISWIDDLRPLPSALRLTVHLAAALTTIGGFGWWTSLALPILGTISLGWLGIVITTVWIVGLTNAYNFMDGTDGIAGAQAVVAGVGWGILGWVTGQPLIWGLGFILAGSSVGFLIHNWPPARIFMGDVGSAFVGYSLAVLPVMFGAFCKDSPGAPIVGLLLVWPFVFDTSFTFLRRLRRGENVFAAHRSHLYQRMSSTNSGHTRVALLYSSLALAGVLLAQVWSGHVASGETSSLLALPFLCLGLWAWVVVHERRHAAA